jgi:opacity protein-like surface antigen
VLKAAPPYPAPRGGAVLLLFCLFAALIRSANAQAAEPVPDPPAQDPIDTLEYWLGPDAAAQAPVLWRAGAGVEFSRFDLGGGLDAEGWQNFYTVSRKQAGWTMSVSGAYQSFDIPASDLTGSGRTIAGIADTSLFLRYDLDRLLPAGDWLLGITGRIKAPTASVRRGLGTGKVDESLSLDAMRLFGRWAVFAYGGYTWRGGAMSGRDTWNGAAGADYRIAPRWNLGLSYEWRQRAFSRPASSLYGYARYVLTDALSVSAYSVAGLERLRPDISAGLQFTWLAFR